MSYIVKNCKALISNDICELYSQKGIHLMTYCYCKDTNCVIKQVIKKCKKVRDTYCYAEKFNPRWQDANDILKLFDIEEIKE